MLVPSGFKIDDAAWPLVQAHISYWGITSANGNALGTTLIDANLANEPSYVDLGVKLLDGNAAGQVRPIAVHNLVTGQLTVVSPFTDNAGAAVQVVAGTRYVILSLSGGGGVGPVPPSIGLWMFGVCDPGMAASLNTVVCPNLAGFPDDIFNDEFWMQVIHNDNAPGTAPEREIRRITNYVGATGAFTTDNFSANVEANDLVAVFHESIMSIEILGFGTLTVSSTTVPADGGRAALYAWENNDYFKGALLMPTEGAARFQPRRIVGFTVAGGVFTLDPNNPFSVLPGLVDYIIIGDQTSFVPAADGTNNTTPEDVIGTKTSTPIYTPSNNADIVRYLKGILNSVVAIHDPSEELFEGWQDLAIDPLIWTVTNPATGAAWTPQVSGAFLYNETAPNANETARLVGDHLWETHSISPNLNIVVKKTVMEFTMIIGVPANVDNTIFFVGFTPNQADTRASNNIIGFGLIADALQTITDLAGAETVNTGFGENLTNHNKLRIEIYEGTVDFYLNEVLIASHDTNIPNVPSYPNFYIDTEPGGACAFDIGIVRVWYEVIERY